MPLSRSIFEKIKEAINPLPTEISQQIKSCKLTRKENSINGLLGYYPSFFCANPAELAPWMSRFFMAQRGAVPSPTTRLHLRYNASI
jgi:hypothetical protein